MKAAYYPDVGLEQMVPDQFWINEECKYNIAAIQLVIRQRVEDFQLKIESYQTQLNLTKPQWDATGLEYKHDYTVIDYPRAIIFRDKYRVQMMMRLNEIHKFSDGTLQQIDEALDYRVKEFKINRMNRVDIEKVAVCSSLRSLKSKRTIESRAKRSSKIISLGHYSILLASSYTVKRLLISVLIFTVFKEASKVESCPSEIILDDLLALDSIVRFDLDDRRLEQSATFSISTNSE
nr:hypothetical protein [Tanacetum cinerariifolium]